MGNTLSYETNQVISIGDKYVGFLYRLVQLTVIAYVIGYVMVYNGGYQEVDNGVCHTFGKIKGISRLFPNKKLKNMDDKYNILDSVDIVMPSYGADKYFIMTMFGLTTDQTISSCSSNLSCNSSDSCPFNVSNKELNGIYNGKCKENLCQVDGWCPIENENITKFYSIDVKNYSLLVKNSVKFNKFNRNEVNIFDSLGKDFLESCRYNNKNADMKHCPIFVFSDILDILQIKNNELSMGVNIEISINWNCNYDSNSPCKPEYKISRVDISSKVAPGYNFRCAEKYHGANNQHFRDLYKCYGIGLQLTCISKAVKFSIIPLLLNIGSGLGLLGLATIMCDIVVFYISPNRQRYRKLIVKSLEDSLSDGSDSILN